VTLTVTGPAGSESLTRSNYLQVGTAVVPTVTYWGVGGLAGLLLAALVWRLRRRLAVSRR
jgi:hypothetical protein